jgi:hypothetical protein
VPNRRSLASLGVTAVVVALLAGAVQLQAARERLYPTAVEAEDTLYLTSGSSLVRLAGAFRVLAADLYWIRAVQYYGGTKHRLLTALEAGAAAPPPGAAGNDYRELYPFLDVTTTLDPRFNIAYRFGAVFLAEAYPAGPGRPDLAVKLLEKGLRDQPDKWEYMQDIGFVHYWYRHDYQSAADSFNRAALIQGAPWWLKSLAATTLAQGGDRNSSRQMWESIRQSAEVDWLRRDAERRLTQLRALDQMDSLQAAVDRFVAATGSQPQGWAPIVRAQGWPGLPVDPSGTPFELTPAGVVRVAQKSPLWPLPVEPERVSAQPRS